MDGPSTTPTSWSSLELPLKKLLYNNRTSVSAAISSLLATMTAFPLDSIKSRLQVNKYDSVMDCVKKTYVEEGPKGFYRGIAIPMFTITIVRTSSVRDIALSGLAGGMSSGFLISVGSCAFELVKIRSQLESAIAAKTRPTVAGYHHLERSERDNQFTWTLVQVPSIQAIVQTFPQ
ncbi:hypothetical protein KEM48_013715 [Puccinia striiformis f. sp. tritici PST-130]|nr:hypothetical protein KEM48_013715 [Puccinia striiformis f. sp. tritici PST-130]